MQAKNILALVALATAAVASPIDNHWEPTTSPSCGEPTTTKSWGEPSHYPTTTKSWGEPSHYPTTTKKPSHYPTSTEEPTHYPTSTSNPAPGQYCGNGQAVSCCKNNGLLGGLLGSILGGNCELAIAGQGCGNNVAMCCETTQTGLINIGGICLDLIL